MGLRVRAATRTSWTSTSATCARRSTGRSAATRSRRCAASATGCEDAASGGRSGGDSRSRAVAMAAVIVALGCFLVAHEADLLDTVDAGLRSRAEELLSRRRRSPEAGRHGLDRGGRHLRQIRAPPTAVARHHAGTLPPPFAPTPRRALSLRAGDPVDLAVQASGEPRSGRSLVRAPTPPRLRPSSTAPSLARPTQAISALASSLLVSGAPRCSPPPRATGRTGSSAAPRSVPSSGCVSARRRSRPRSRADDLAVPSTVDELPRAGRRR